MRLILLLRNMFKFRKYGHWYFLGALALACFAVWSAVFYVEAHRGLVYLHVLDVGQGDAIFIEAPNGNQVLIDGGPDNSVMARLGEVMPFWDRSIDLVILTHPHADHLDGLLEALKRYDVGMVMEPGVSHTIPEYGEWKRTVAAKGITRVVAKRGETVRLGDSAKLEILSPFDNFEDVVVENVHDAVVVVRLEHASSSALLMADAEAPLERRLAAAAGDMRAEVLKVGHHGSKTSTSEWLLTAVRPRYAAISVGRKNRYGHPVAAVLRRLSNFGIETHRTDEEGSITFRSDGRGFVFVDGKR